MRHGTMTAKDVEEATQRGREVLAANSGTSEGAKKGWEQRTIAAHKITASVDHLEQALGPTKDPEELKQLAIAHDKAHEAHNSAAYHAEHADDISGVQAEIVAHRHQQMSAHHAFAARRIRALRERLESAKTK